MSVEHAAIRLPEDDVGGEVVGAKVRCPLRYIDLVQVTPYFAPSAPGEELEIEYDTKGMAAVAITLEITDRNGFVVYSRFLTASEKRAPVWGLKSITWNGEIEDGQYITPMFSPFKVALLDDISPEGVNEKPFRVLCESLEIKMAPWDPAEAWTPATDPPGLGPAYQKWLRFKLNHLGYYAGPVDGGLGQYEANAKIRYRATHKELVKLNYADYGAITLLDATALTKGLKDNDNSRPYFTRPGGGQARTQLKAGDNLKLAQGDQKLRVHVEALPWMANVGADEMVNQYAHVAAVNPITRIAQDQARLNRPLIPIEAVVYLKGSDGRPKLAPKGLGPVQINWSYTEPQEELSHQFADDPAVCSYPRRYVEKCLKLHGGRLGPTNNNCPSQLGGIRGASLPFLAGAHYPHSDAQVNGPLLETFAYNGATVQGVVHEKRLARAGLYFQPSYIAGDAYVIKATLVTVGLDATQAAVSQETNPIEVWRCAKVAAVVGWPKKDLSACWPAVKEQYAKAYTDLDVSAIADLAMAAVMTPQVYTTWADTVIDPVAIGGVFKNTYSAHGMTSFQPDRDERDDPGMYFQFFLADDKLDALWAAIHRTVRVKQPSGLVFVTHRAIDPREFTEPVPATSMSLSNGAVLLDHGTPGAPYHIVSHEMGHCFWLNHGRHTLQSLVNFPQSEMAKDHDPSDHNCIMDYTKEDDAAHPHRAAATYRPKFCGKCNLKLRGWDVVNVALPMDLPRVVACEWDLAP